MLGNSCRAEWAAAAPKAAPVSAPHGKSLPTYSCLVLAHQLANTLLVCIFQLLQPGQGWLISCVLIDGSDLLKQLLADLIMSHFISAAHMCICPHRADSLPSGHNLDAVPSNHGSIKDGGIKSLRQLVWRSCRVIG